MAIFFNQYFTNFVSNLVRELPPTLNMDFLNNISRNNNTFYLNETNSTEILIVILNIKRKGNNVYDIDFKVFFAIKDKVVYFLEYLYNLCMNNAIYPSLLKLARVTPIHKSGNTRSVFNYRPISNLNIFGKIFEKIINERLNNFAKANCIIN